VDSLTRISVQNWIARIVGFPPGGESLYGT